MQGDAVENTRRLSGGLGMDQQGVFDSDIGDELGGWHGFDTDAWRDK